MNKVYIFFEARQNWINKLSNEFKKEILNKMSTFLLDYNSIKLLAKHLKENNDYDFNIELIEINDLSSFNKTINNTDKILFWNITDGTGIYKGSYIPSYAKLLDYNFYGSETHSQYLSCDKYKFYLICKGLTIPTPNTFLFYNGNTDYKEIKKLSSKNEYFVKPNNLDNNIGIKDESKCFSVEKAIDIANNLYKEYSSSVLIQEFIAGKDIRISYLDVSNEEIPVYNRINDIENKLGIYYVTKIDKNGDPLEFLTENSKDVTEYFKLVEDVNIINKITIYMKKLIVYLRIEDYFSVDIKITDNNQLYFLEINTAPFIIGERFRRYIKDIYDLTLEDAILKSLNRYFIQ